MGGPERAPQAPRARRGPGDPGHSSTRQKAPTASRCARSRDRSAPAPPPGTPRGSRAERMGGSAWSVSAVRSAFASVARASSALGGVVGSTARTAGAIRCARSPIWPNSAGGNAVLPCTSSIAAFTAPHWLCPSTTTSLLPSTLTAYSRLPTTSSDAMFARHPADEEGRARLIEDQLGTHPRIRAAEHGRHRRLPGDQLRPRLDGEPVGDGLGPHVPAVPRHELLEDRLRTVGLARDLRGSIGGSPPRPCACAAPEPAGTLARRSMPRRRLASRRRMRRSIAPPRSLTMARRVGGASPGISGRARS